MREDIDALLYATADKRTEALHLDALLPGIKQNAKKSAVRSKPRRYAVMAGCAAIAAALAGILLLDSTVVVEGKTYLMLGGSIVIDGQTYSAEGSAQTRLVHLEGNQYAVLPDEDDFSSLTGQIMVFEPDTGEMPEKKPATEDTTDVYSIEPILVYPVVGDLVVRAGPDMKSAELGMLHAGQCVVKVGMDKNWAVLSWAGDIAYAFDAYLFDAPDKLPAYPAVEKYATEELNVRALPTSRDESAVLYELYKGERVQVTGVIGAWSQIERDGGKAYVFSRYLTDAP